MSAEAEAWLRARELARAGDVEGLIELLADPLARATAARRLGRLGDRRAVRPLARLLSVRDFHTRASAARALGEIGAPEAIDPLVSALAEWSGESVRGLESIDWRTKLLRPSRLEADADQRGAFYTWVLGALASLGANEALRPLIAFLEHRDRSIRVWAAKSLATLGDESALDAVRAAARREPFYRRRPFRQAIRELQRRPGSSSARP